MNNLSKALIGASLINTIFSEYTQGELGKYGELTRGRIAKFMRQRGKTNKKELLDAIHSTDKAWRTTINHFAKEKLAIEAKSTITAIYDYFQVELTRFANVTESHIENFSIGATDDKIAEHNSTMVIDFLIEELGMEKRKSLFAGKKHIIKNNLILEDKQIAEGF